MADKYLRQLVVDELDFDPSVDAANIGVAVESGVVTLTGHVGSYAEKMAVERAVQRVKGVHGIAEEIEIRYPADKKMADDLIAERAINIIGWDTQIPRDAVMVKVQKGWVTLTGTVDWYYQKMRAELAIRKLSGVVGVANQIELKPRVQTTDVKSKILQCFEAQCRCRSRRHSSYRARRQGEARGQGQGLVRAQSRRARSLVGSGRPNGRGSPYARLSLH